MNCPLRLDNRAPGFAAAFDALVDARREADADVSRDVAKIVADVRAKGDEALSAYTKRFDRHDLAAGGWQLTLEERRAALEGLDRDLRDAPELAAARIRAYHDAQRPADSDGTDEAGVRMGARWNAVEAAGL